MRGTFLFLLLLISNNCIAQTTRVITARIVDKDSQKPLEFVNVGFIDKAIGTVTSTSGHFILAFDMEDLEPTDVLQISSLGYESRNLSLEELKRLSAKPVTIPLTSTPYHLGEVVVKSVPRAKKTIGHKAFTAASMGYWEGEDALGGEIASVIRIRKENTHLHRLSFNVLENRSDSLRIRIHIYEYHGGDPERLITNGEILHTIRRKKGLETIDLTPYRIKTSNDVLASIQLVEAYGPDIYFALSASAYGGLSFIRERMMPYWRPQKTVCVGFRIESSFPLKATR